MVGKKLLLDHLFFPFAVLFFFQVVHRLLVLVPSFVPRLYGLRVLIGQEHLRLLREPLKQVLIEQLALGLLARLVPLLRRYRVDLVLRHHLLPANFPMATD